MEEGMQEAITKYEDCFYNYKDFLDDKYCTKISGTHVDDDDIRRYRRFVKDCFSLHLPHNPKRLLLKDIKLAPAESNRFYNSQDISNLFISEIYKYPSIKRYREDDIDNHIAVTHSDNVFDEILGNIANPNTAVVLVGDVGEGKSAFLKKLSVDLNYFIGDLKYIPIIIDIERFKHIIEKDNTEEAFEGFWKKVCEEIILYLELELKINVATSVSKTSETGSSSEISFGSTLKAIIAELRSTIKLNTFGKNSTISTRTFDVFSQILNASKKLYQDENIRMVLIFDNLDTFCYEHERFMLFEKGFAKLKTKIITVRKIIHEVITHLSNSEISFVFTARPYVYYHAFQKKVHEISWEDISAVYSLESSGTNKPMQSRLKLIKILAKKLHDFKLPPGKLKAMDKHHSIFTRIIDTCLAHNSNYMLKFYNLSNQGMRSMVEFYKSSDYHPELFERYFSHNILYLYMLGRKELYSQVPPKSCSHEQRYFFPNMFLVMCDNFRNREYKEACLPHKVTYWLKYLILRVCFIKKQVSINELLRIFSDYDEHVVYLCIGSLATVNEYNCLKMKFGHDIDFSIESDAIENSLLKFKETTYLSPTKRGKYLIENNFCLCFECLQLYVDDWLLPLPKKEKLLLEEQINNIYDFNKKKYSYNYLLNLENYETERKSMISKKAKQSLLLLKFLEGAFKAEQELYENTWKKINEIDLKEPLFNDKSFKKMQAKLIDDSHSAYGKDDKFKTEIESYNQVLNNSHKKIDNLFKIAVKIITN